MEGGARSKQGGVVEQPDLRKLSGAFIAPPPLATFKISCDYVESLAPIGGARQVNWTGRRWTG